MILKGLLVVASGFIFIFSPGVPMKLISRYRPDYKKEGLYWGIGIWIIPSSSARLFKALPARLLQAVKQILN